MLFLAGRTGACAVHEALRKMRMLASEQSADSEGSQPMVTPQLNNPLSHTDLVDWGVIPTMLHGESRTFGKLLHKGSEGRSECGIWRCTPGKWVCHVTRDLPRADLRSAAEPAFAGAHRPAVRRVLHQRSDRRPGAVRSALPQRFVLPADKR